MIFNFRSEISNLRSLISERSEMTESDSVVRLEKVSKAYTDGQTFYALNEIDVAVDRGERVAIARALIFDPPLLLADEPTGNLDSASGEEILKLLEELHRELNSTILLVTHDEHTAATCERMLILRDGRVAEDHASVVSNDLTEAV